MEELRRERDEARAGLDKQSRRTDELARDLEAMRRDLESQAVEDSFLGVSGAGRFGPRLCLF